MQPAQPQSQYCSHLTTAAQHAVPAGRPTTNDVCAQVQALVWPPAQVSHVGSMCQMHTADGAHSRSAAGPLHSWITIQGSILEFCQLGLVAYVAGVLPMQSGTPCMLSATRS